MRKKWLLLVIIFSIMAIPNITSADANMKGKNLLDTLGISAKNYGCDGDGYITRSNAAKLVLGVINCTEIPKYTRQSFDDVSSETMNYNEIEYCIDMGIISVDKEFHPNKPITMAEFSKMVCCALGYRRYASALGGYPDGYLNIAKQCDFYQGINLSGDSYIKCSDADEISASILLSEYIPIDKYENKENINVLYKFFGIYRVSGIITQNEITGLYAPVGVAENHIKIDNEEYLVSDLLKTDLLYNIGYNIDAWVIEEDDDIDRIICFRQSSKMHVTEIDSDDFISLREGKIRYYDNGKDKTVNLPISCSIIFNGEAVSDEISADVFKGRWGKIKIIKANGGNVSTILIKAYDNYFVSSIDALNYECFDGTRETTLDLPQSISFRDKSGEIAKNTYFFNNIGETKKFDDISVNSVISVAKNNNNIECIITKESISGRVESIDVDEEETSICIDNNMYFFSKEMKNSRSKNIRIGGDYVCFLDANGKIAAAKEKKSNENEMIWAYLIGLSNESDDRERVMMKAITSTDGRVALPCAKKINIDGKSHKSDYKVLENIFKEGGNAFVKQLVRFSVNDNGEINKIDTVSFDSSAESMSNSLHLVFDGKSVPTYFKSNLKSFGMNVQYNANTVVFYIPEDESKLDDYIVVPLSKFVTDKKYRIKAYSTDRYSFNAEAIICYDNVVSTSPMMYQDYLTVVSDISVGLNDNNEVVTKITGYQKDNEASWNVQDSNVMKIGRTQIGYSSSPDGNLSVGVGDTIRFDTDSDGNIVNIQLIYDCSESEFHMPISADVQNEYIVSIGNGYSINEIGMVIPFRIKDGGIICATDTSIKPDHINQKYIVMSLSYFKMFEVDMTGKKPTVRKISSSDIKTWYDSGVTDEILCKCRYDEGRSLIVYKK